MLLFWCLYHLVHKLLETLVVGEDDERVAKKIMPPLANGCCDCMELPHVCRRMLEAGAENLTEECYGVRTLG